MIDLELENKYEEVLKRMTNQFGDDLDLQALLFLIGVQELGKGKVNLSKNEKLDVIHIAICTLLTPYGYYEYEGLDKDGWPPLESKRQAATFEARTAASINETSNS